MRAKGLRPGAEGVYDSIRIPLGLPEGGRDMEAEKALLLENGYDELGGIDWEKGCYMGQELTARMKYRGLVRKRLLPVRLSGEGATPGTPVLAADGQDVGELRSVHGDWALALIRVERMRRAAEGGLSLSAGGLTVLPDVPDWVRLPAPKN